MGGLFSGGSAPAPAPAIDPALEARTRQQEEQVRRQEMEKQREINARRRAMSASRPLLYDGTVNPEMGVEPLGSTTPARSAPHASRSL